jgi:hypothetical protein
MPRKARIDAPGALHHIIVRGIECRRIFSDDQDRDNFVERLGDIVTETETFCFAWALIPNHIIYYCEPPKTLLYRLNEENAAYPLNYVLAYSNAAMALLGLMIEQVSVTEFPILKQRPLRQESVAIPVKRCA